MADPIERFFEPIALWLRAFLADMGLWQVLALFFAGALAVLFFGSFASGWHKLAQHYPREQRFDGEWILMPDFHDNPGGQITIDFNGQEQDNIDLGVDGQGLYLSMQWPFRLFHAPIFVPWNDIRAEAWSGIPWSDRKTEVRFTFARCPEVPIHVGLDVAREMAHRAAGRWSVPAGFPAQD